MKIKSIISLFKRLPFKIIEFLCPVLQKSYEEHISDSYDVDFSIIVHTFQHEKSIERALLSILSQKTKYTYEIIIIDDGSQDATQEIINKISDNNPGKISPFYMEKNTGRARTALFHLRPNVRGKYWGVLDGDDFWISENKIEKQVGFLESNSKYVAVNHYTKYTYSDGSESISKPDMESWDIGAMMCGKVALYAHTSSWVWRNMFHDKDTGFFIPSILQQPYTFGDSCFNTYFAQFGGRIRTLKEVMSCYNINGKGIWSSLSKNEQDKLNLDNLDNLDRLTEYQYSKEIAVRKMKLKAKDDN